MNLRKLTLLFFIMASVGLSHAQSFYLCTQGDTRTASQVTFSNNGSTLNGNIQTNTIDSITMHVPALKYVGGDISLLPKYEEQVRFISSALEEKEREEFSRMKVIKRQSAKKAESA